ncbi:hypothetical protein [Actinacidiphila acididurans]|uniref:Chromosome partition protein Smc n=1 Tax=Actinacidiphila acididurans TaxID=2784346 RepID=A0ABS2U5K2_9ACTN|nr:hypothetical protein [Actinacidiphila acididurans]MBM9509996.1 hypothetical protein [Actinacidiphila acididurans]
MADYLPPVVAKLEGDHSGLTRVLASSKEDVKRWALEVGKTKATLQVDAKLADGTLAALRQKIADSPAAKLDVDLRLKTGTLTTLRDKVKDSTAARLDVTVALESGTLATLRQEVRDSPAAKLSTELRLADGTLAALRQKVKDSTAATLLVELNLQTGTLAAVRDKVKDSAAAKLSVAASLDSSTLATVRQEVADGDPAKLGVDLRLKDGTLAALREKVADSPAAKLKVKLDLATGEREALQTQLADREVQVKVTPKLDQVALRRVQTVLMELGRPITVSVRPDTDTGAQARAEARIARLTRDRTVVVRTRVIGGGSPGGGGGGGIADDIKPLATLISLAPSLVPVAASLTASLVSIAEQAGAAGVALGAFGLAAKSQITAIGAAADAQAKYNAAVAKYGANSKQAIAAQEASARSLDGMPAATQRATEGWLGLKDAFKAWSDSLAGATMEPVNRSFAVAEAILPRLSPLVRTAADQLNRFVTIAGGAVASPGLDGLMKRLTAFSGGVLKRLNDDLVHFLRYLDEGPHNGAIAQVFAYAKAEGPQVHQALDDIARAIGTILKASAQAGPGLLTVVDDIARLVAALPPSFVATVLDAYAAFRLFKVASAGITAVTGAVTSLSGRLVVLRAASQAAGGGLAGVRAAIGSISTAGKIGGAIAVIAGIAVVLDKLSSSGKKAPDVDRMTTALGRLSQTGKASGELTSVFGADLDGLGKAIDRVSGKSSGMDKFNDTMNRVFTLGMGQSNSMKQAKKDIDAIDKGLAALVSGGHADQAAQALKDLSKAGLNIPKKSLDDYNSALADAAFQAKLTAQSEGMFGDQAQQVQKKLDAQKQAAQGLQQAILDLNDANRAALDAESAYQQSIDDATAAIKGHRDALHYSNGELNLNSQKAREAYAALSQMAAAAEASSTATLQQTGSQEKANKVLIDAHDRLVATAEKMGLSTSEAHKLADALDNIKDPKIQVTVATQAAEANLAAAKKKVDSFPKSTRTKANFDYQQAAADVQFFQRIIDQLHGKTVTVRINNVSTQVNAKDYYSQGPHKNAYGGVVRAFDAGGTVPGYAPMRDTVPAVLSPGEGVLVPEATRALGGESGINAINRQARSGGSLSSASLSGGVAPIGREVAAGLWQGLQSQQGWLAAQARQFALSTIPQPMADALGIASPSKVAMSLGRWVGAGMVQGLTGSTASVKSATLRLTRSIEQVFHDDAQRQLASDRKSFENLVGVKGKKAARERSDLLADMKQQQKYLSEDSAISRFVAVDNQRLLKLAAQRDSVASKLKTAQANLSSLQKQWTSERDQVASQILQGASVVTAAPQAGFALTAGDVVNNLKDQAEKGSTFAAELQQLQKAGLRSDLIAQIAAAGVDQGGATAAALAGASKDTIKQLNSIQANLASSANATGAAVADSMYKAGIDSAKGLIKGLESQESAIEKQMLKIAKSMQTAIREELGIHSPSTVMAMDGEHTGRGFALGLDRSVKHVQIAASGLAMAARQGASLTSSGGYRGGGGGEVHYHYNSVNLTVQGSVTTARQLVDEVENALAVRARTNPGGFRPAATWSGR